MDVNNFLKWRLKMSIGHSYYKYRFWLGSLDHNTLNHRQYQELIWLLAWGPEGCDSYNYRIAEEFRTRYRNPDGKDKPVCIRTIRNDLRILERNRLIVTIPGWAQIAGGKFVKQLRDRRIIVIPYPTKTDWLKARLKHDLSKIGSRNRPGKKHTPKIPAWQQRKALLAGKKPSSL